MDNKNKFAVKLPSFLNDINLLYKTNLVNTIIDKYPHLTMAGIDTPYETSRGNEINGIENAKPNDYITFGTSRTHDVNWMSKGEEDTFNYLNRTGVPVYDLQKDYGKVMYNLDKFATANKPKETCNCDYCNYNKVQKFDAFTKVGYTIIPTPKITPTYCYGYFNPYYTVRVTTISIKF